MIEKRHLPSLWQHLPSFRLYLSSFRLYHSSFRLFHSSFRLFHSSFRLFRSSFRLSRSSFRLSRSLFRLFRSSFRLFHSSFRLSRSPFRLSRSSFRLFRSFGYSFRLFRSSFRRKPESSETLGRRSLPRHVVSRGRHVNLLDSGFRRNDGGKIFSVPKLVIHILWLLLMYGATCQADTDKQALTLESIFAGSEFENNLPQNIQWHNDEQSFTFTRKNPETGLLDIHEHDVAGSATRLIISGDTLRYKNEPVGMSSYQGAAGSPDLSPLG